MHLPLLKEDFISSLRDGITSFIDQPRKKVPNLHFYRDVQLRLITNYGVKKQVNLFIDLNKDNNKIDTTNFYSSKRFMFGSLLLLTSTEQVDDLILVTVSNRNKDSLSFGLIQVEILKIYNKTNGIFNQNMIMFESEIYFEPYHQVYTTIKNYTEKHFPLKNYIIECQIEPEYPAYISQNNGKLFYKHNGYVFDVKDPKSWPRSKELNLNDSQLNAFQAALTRKFSVIQGPPGTGKTFIGHQIVSALLSNTESQILVICLTNHALDSFLMGIIPFTRKIVRLGNMSKNEILDEFNIKNLNQPSDDKRIRTGHYLLMQREGSLILQLDNELNKPNSFESETTLNIQSELRSISKRHDDLRQVQNYNLIKNKRVIGMTTTYAARARSLLGLLKTPIVVIEETAEVLETHVLACLTEYTQQAILIGISIKFIDNSCDIL